MTQIEIYTSPLCGYCHMAKRLLKAKGAEFTEINVWADPGRKPEMIERAGGRRTVPQIFIDGVHVGGCDELHALERAGRLDSMLAAGQEG
ncbi:MAG: glutaredoxin 3 [Pararhodobacter sp.]|nr:glutaredoxin 3 [Pararhodobacter sp.]